MDPEAAASPLLLSRRAVVAGTLAAGALGACGRATRVRAAVADLELHARHQLGEGFLRVEYRVRNLADAPAFLFNVLHRDFDAGVFPLDPSGYVEIGPETVIVSRKLFAVPPFTLVEKKNIPFMTRVAPGELFSAQLHLATPLVARNPYEAEVPEGGATAGRALIFELGYFIGAPGTEQVGTMFPTDAGPRPGFEAFGEDKQRLARTERLGDVPVIMLGTH